MTLQTYSGIVSWHVYCKIVFTWCFLVTGDSSAGVFLFFSAHWWWPHPLWNSSWGWALWGYQHDTSYSPSTPRCCLVHSPLVLHRGPECILSRKSQITSGCISGAPHPVWPDWKKPQSDSALLSAHVYVSSEPSVQSPPLYRSKVWSVLTALPDLSEGICLVCLSKLTEERTEKTLQDKIHL